MRRYSRRLWLALLVLVLWGLAPEARAEREFDFYFGSTKQEGQRPGYASPAGNPTNGREGYLYLKFRGTAGPRVTEEVRQYDKFMPAAAPGAKRPVLVVLDPSMSKAEQDAEVERIAAVVREVTRSEPEITRTFVDPTPDPKAIAANANQVEKAVDAAIDQLPPGAEREEFRRQVKEAEHSALTAVQAEVAARPTALEPPEWKESTPDDGPVARARTLAGNAWRRATHPVNEQMERMKHPAFADRNMLPLSLIRGGITGIENGADVLQGGLKALTRPGALVVPANGAWEAFYSYYQEHLNRLIATFGPPGHWFPGSMGKAVEFFKSNTYAQYAKAFLTNYFVFVMGRMMLETVAFHNADPTNHKALSLLAIIPYGVVALYDAYKYITAERALESLRQRLHVTGAEKRTKLAAASVGEMLGGQLALAGSPGGIPLGQAAALLSLRQVWKYYDQQVADAAVKGPRNEPIVVVDRRVAGNLTHLNEISAVTEYPFVASDVLEGEPHFVEVPGNDAGAKLAYLEGLNDVSFTPQPPAPPVPLHQRICGWMMALLGR